MKPNPPLFHAVQSERLSEQINRQLLETITAGHYQQGDQLPSERDLAEMFGVSRAAVREALRSLSSKGIISIRQGRGTTVNSVEEWNSLDPDVLMLMHGDKVFSQLIEVRQIIEPELAALAARNITPEELEELRLATDLPEEDTIEEHVERDTAFHQLIAKASRNQVLLIVLTSISPLLSESRRRTFVVPGELARARKWHQTIYAAIEAGDAEASRKAMAKHMKQVESGLARFSKTYVNSA
ncbi:MAG TPA: FadR family transcriptional regulator [Chloroflexi bacterium]|jgi:DNA-binding FadR family transcriptional regulator|nr:FadR family transcriptional regulator [Chloroflexota bacterium]